MSKARLFRYCCLSFVAGISLASFFPVIANFYLFVIIFFLFIFLSIIWPKTTHRNFLLISIFFIFGLWRLGVSFPTEDSGKIYHYNGQKLGVEGRVSREPIVGGKSQQLVLSVERIAESGMSVKGNLLVIKKVYPLYSYGDFLRVECELKKPEPLGDFAYDRYLARFGIHSSCLFPKIKVLEEKQNNTLGRRAMAIIIKLKERSIEIINRGLPEPEAGLARAMVLGDKKGLDEEVKDDFARSGLSHIAAISGMHIGIFVFLLSFLLLGLGLSRKQSFYIALFVLMVYIILVGFPASAVRAGLMASLLLWAMHIGRLAKPLNCLIFAAALILLINPKMLRDDVGFQLSFLAVVGIVSLYGYFDDRIKKIFGEKFRTVFSIINITVCAQIFTLPVIVANFSQLSLSSILSNLLVVWLLPFLMAFILAGAFLSAMFPAYSAVLFFPSKLMIDYILAAAKIFSEFLPGVLVFESFPFLFIAIYFVLALVLFYSAVLKKTKKDLMTS